MNRRLLGRIGFVLICVTWLFIVTFNYYIVHKPFGAENGLALLSVGADVLILTLLLVVTVAVGRRLSRFVQFDSQLESIVLCAGLGWGALSFVILALGLLGLLHPLAFWAMFVFALILLRSDVRMAFEDARAIRFPIISPFERVLAVFVAATLALALVRALTPPLAWDAQVYHLAEGKFWIAQGRIAAPPDVPNFSFPALVEVLYLGAFLLKGDILAQLIHWSFLPLTLGLVFIFAQRYFSPRTSWLAAALLASVPSFVLVASWPYIDTALAFYATAALYSVMRGTTWATERVPQNHGARWFILAGAFTGLALGVKYTALIVPAAVLVVLLISGFNRALLKQLIPGGGLAALLAAPWYLRNWIFQGNPFYPFFFGGRFWDSFRSAQFSKFGTGFAGEPWRLLVAPWEATIFGQEGLLGYQTTIGPLLLALLPILLVVSWRRDRALSAILAFAATLYAFWLLGIAGSKELANTRLLFPTFPAFALAAAVGLERLSQFDLPHFSLSRFARLVTAVILGLTLIAQTLDLAALNPLPFLTGFESRDQYLGRRLTPNGYYAAMQSLSGLSPDNKVLFLWEPRSYYAGGRVQVVPDAMLDRFGDLRFRYGDPGAMAAALRAEGITHILLNRVGLNYFVTTPPDTVTRSDVAALQQLLAQNFRQLSGQDSVELVANGSMVNAASDAYALYEILPSARAGK